MKMQFIFEGEAKEVDKVLRENKIRVARGVIKFTPVPAVLDESEEPAPVEEPAVLDEKKSVVTDTKAAPAADVKSPKNNKNK